MILQFTRPAPPIVPFSQAFRYQRELIWRAYRRTGSQREWERRLGFADLDFYARQAFCPSVRTTAAGLLAAARRRAATSTTKQ